MSWNYGIKPEMPRKTPNPNPQFTVWAIMATVVALLAIVGFFAVSQGDQGFFRLTGTGGTLPAGFVAVALVVGFVSVGIFIHRGPTKPKE